MSDDVGFLPHQDLEAEEAALGAAVISPKAAAVLVEVLEEVDFFRPSHRILYSVIRSLLEGGQGVDETVVMTRLRSIGKLEDVGGHVAILELVERVPAVANARSYCGRVKEVAVLRRLADGMQAAFRATHTADGAEEALRLAEGIVFGAADRMAGSAVEFRTETMAADWYSSLFLPEHGGDPVDWPIDQITKRLGGLRQGQVIAFGMRTGGGKTWFGLDVIEVFAQLEKRSLLISMEMDREEIMERLVAMGGHDYADVQAGKIHPPVMKGRADEINGWPLTLLDDADYTVGQIRAELARAKADGRPYRLVVIDHLHLMTHPGRDLRLGIDQTVKELKQLAKRYGVTILVLAQLTRPADKKPDAEPTLYDFKESGGIENIANVALMAWKVWEHGEETDDVIFRIVKARGSRKKGRMAQVWSNTHYRFRPLGTVFSGSPVPTGQQTTFEEIIL